MPIGCALVVEDGVIRCRVRCAQDSSVQPRAKHFTEAGATAARLALRAALVLGAIVEYPNSECGFEQRLAARDHAHRVHDVAAFDLFDHVAGRARQDRLDNRDLIVERALHDAFDLGMP